tara:strand:- start:1 stop:207 length:207 start_codon:yes stop_codon:yes gene_type:complete
MKDKIKKDDFVNWDDFLALASKVRQQEELIKICFQNVEILRNRLKEIDVDLDEHYEHNERLRELERGQ